MKSKKIKITFLGTGPSSGVPNLYCLSHGGCKTCLGGKNNRTNVSIILCKEKSLLIDCTKDFKLQYERYLMKEIGFEMSNHNSKREQHVYSDNNEIKNDFSTKCKTIRDVLITHPHADAILGLDTLEQTIPKMTICNVYANEETAHYLLNNYQYLFAKSENKYHRNGLLNINVIEEQKEYTISDFVVKPYSVKHGRCFSFMFLIDNKILYVSDCSEFSTNITAEILIIECTTMKEHVNGHLKFSDVLQVIDIVNPRITYLFGMSHLIDNEELKTHIKKLDKNIVVAYDMMEIEI